MPGLGLPFELFNYFDGRRREVVAIGCGSTQRPGSISALVSWVS
jgi:hypothetical protein